MSGLTRWEPTTRWNPFKELEEMEKRLSGYFGRTATPAGGDKKESISVAEWAPLVDISEDDKEYAGGGGEVSLRGDRGHRAGPSAPPAL